MVVVGFGGKVVADITLILLVLVLVVARGSSHGCDLGDLRS
jgi:hypothetical protein